MLASRGESLEGKVVLVSGSGNVAQYTVEKLLDLGAKPVTLSDSSGCVHDPDGIDREKLAFVMELKNVRRGRIREYCDEYPGARYLPADPRRSANAEVWSIPGHCAFPSATQNEIDGEAAARLLASGVYLVSEGANMPCTPEAMRLLVESRILYGPAKAANAGGVATSGLEMTQNSMRLSWSREEVDDRLRRIMADIFRTCSQTAERFGTPGNLVNGANIAGFLKVADAMMDQGLV
jgi:glutamate dehydrogenase (NADP+)